ncbi:MAG: hypothetical protein N2170_00885 [Bacteroidia bacterium]|nr:hypothetical protein [Bacteroidia bacterium]
MRKKILLFGLGNVGGGFYRLFSSLSAFLPAEIIGVVVKHREKHPNIPHIYSYDDLSWRDSWEKADIVIECTSDPIAGWEIIFRSLQAGKVVITSSKRPLAENLSILAGWLESHPKAVLYHEAAAAASIPVFGGILSHFSVEPSRELVAVLNGTSHYILEQVFQRGLSLEEALLEAQARGYAEENPHLDLSGWDAAYKLILFVWHLFQKVLSPSELFVTGIYGISPLEVEYLSRHKVFLKPVAYATSSSEGLYTYVGPAILPSEHPFAGLRGAENGIILDLLWAGKQYYQGLGAGPSATASAVMGDLCFHLFLGKSPHRPPLPDRQIVLPTRPIDTFYVRGDALIESLSGGTKVSLGDIPAIVWTGPVDLLRSATQSLPPDRFCVARVFPEALTRLSGVAGVLQCA